MKKFVKKVIPFILFCLLFMVGVPVCIDPYNVFHYKNLRDNGVEPNQNYIKMKYILSNPNKYDAFMFGSSRVGVIHTENISDLNCYNMAYSLGTPKEHLSNIKTLINNGIVPKIIYLGVDSLSYTVDEEEHYTNPIRCPYEYSVTNPSDFWSLYFNPRNALQSTEVTLEGKHDYSYEGIYNYGWWLDYDSKEQLQKENATVLVGPANHIESTLNDIKEIKRICEENNIELVVFTNPMYELTYNDSVDNLSYFTFLEELAEITSFYNFSSLNYVTTDASNYVDSSHYTAEIGDLIIDNITAKNSNVENLNDFGFYVTNNNVKEVVSELKGEF